MAPVGCIPNGTSAIVVKIILYFLGAFLGFFVCIPVGVTLRNFHGACILFAEVVRWQKDIIWPWNEPSCLYVLYMNLAINIFYATFMGAINLIIYCKKPMESKSSLELLLDWNISYILRAFNPVFMVVNFCIMFFEIAGACILTAGLAEFCNKTLSYINRLPDKSARGLLRNSSYSGCSELGVEKAFWSQLDVVRGTDDGVRGHSFYGCLVVATIASWLLFIIWLTQFGLNVIMSCRVCSCDVAEEKKKPDKTAIIAQRRSRLATPIATPGGMLTPSRGLSFPNPMGNQYRGMTPMGATSSYDQYPPPQQAEPLPGKRPPPSPAESSTPPKQDLSYADSQSPRPLPVPKQKQVYRKNPPSTSTASHLV